MIRQPVDGPDRTMDNVPTDSNNNHFIYQYSRPGQIHVCCELKFPDHSQWMKHMRSKYPNAKLQYCCTNCGSFHPKILSVSVHYTHCLRNIPPVIQIDQVGPADQASAVASVAPDVLEFPCKWCDQSFTTKTGLGVHCRRQHPHEFEAELPTIRVRARWSDEERRVLAIAEANLPPNCRFKNQALAAKFTNRPFEGIKKERQTDKYKAILRDVVAQRILPGTPIRQLPILSALGVPVSSPRRSLPRTPVGDLSAVSETVQRFPNLSPEPEVVDDVANPFLEAIKRAATSCNDENLKTVVDSLTNNNFETNSMNDYMKRYSSEPVLNRRTGSSDTTRYRRQVKLKRYARFQQMFRNNRKNLANMIIDDQEEANIFPTKESVEATYKTLYETPSPADDEPFRPKPTAARPVYYPVTKNEVTQELKTMPTTCPGPDNFKIVQLKALKPEVLEVILNYQLWRQEQLIILKVNKTSLIPKCSEGLEDASNWRPITISSAFVRLLHRILAKRISNAVDLNIRQKAFVPVDGCFENVLMLDDIIASARKLKKRLQIVGIDLAKAFDSVSIHSIDRAMRRFQIDEGMRN